MTSAKDIACVFEYLSLDSDGKDIEKTRLLKLLYFAQGYTLAELDHELFYDEIEAWDYGPVIPYIYHNFDDIIKFAKAKGIKDIHLSSDEMDIIMDVWDLYGGYSAKELVNLTHKDNTPWSATYKPNAKNVHIPQNLIKQYFSHPENRLKSVFKLEGIPVVDALPSDEYYPDEDAVWEALLNDAR